MWQLFFGISVGPALLLLALFKKWDSKRPEPPGKVRNMVLFGILSCVPAYIIEKLLMASLGDLTTANGGLIEAYVVAAVTEETLKLTMVMLYIWRNPAFDEVMDGILYTAASSLGFAILENIEYVSMGGLATGIVRAFTAVPLHATASGIMGYFVGRAKFAKGGGTFVWLLFGLATAVFIHGTYDWIAMSGGSFGMTDSHGKLAGNGIIVLCGVLGIPILGMIVLRFLVKSAHRMDDQMLGTQARPLPSMSPQVAYAGGYAPQQYPQQPYPQQQYPQQPYGQPQGGAMVNPYAAGYTQPAQPVSNATIPQGPGTPPPWGNPGGK